ncbi:Mog1p/PsbP-like protein [Trametes versicolor FP-101664 SS1]|uniref:Mog1p/PsbP-like protein n=1 Tax=Trametes versicolor (strain FP-101664) TaxID=717944 RepID=UPI0004624949|nr:Mog1p/PsbP-like protein [Trametes versicolor FP-101664 SS1]EIW60576.1 Mog1p/PsbP-like protein [Trametes versicolor FP-101664 SS1]
MSGSRELFGGAITATLPVTFLDASNFRQVPDTQEVYLSPDSGISIIVEVLESVSATDLREAAGQHFDSLAHDNDAKSQSVIEAVEVSNDSKGATPNPTVLYGTQAVQKFNTATADEVRILLALYRVSEKKVDLVMTMNAPMTGSDGDAITEKEWGTARDAFNTAARSLRIVDYGLFA